jgi:DNA processing protein
VALSRLAEPGDRRVGEAVAEHGPAAVLAGIRAGRFGGRSAERYRVRLPSVDVTRDLAVARACGARVVAPGDAEWPTRLDDLGSARPLLLWVRGLPDLAALTERSVAVVGARAASEYGEHVAADLGSRLGDRGWTVVSGAAFGVDAAAHRGALASDAPTVAVLACGVDTCYPASHDRLLARIVACGAVVTELAPGSHPTRSRFLERNRVIAALARGTVVVEAALRSGARNTAGHADALSRAVMAVPGPVTSSLSAGCHEMIRTEGALLVTDAADVVDIVGDLGVDASPARRGEERPLDLLPPDALRVLDALPRRRWVGPDAVAAAAGVDAPTVMRALTALAAAGLAESRDGGWHRSGRDAGTRRDDDGPCQGVVAGTP